MNERCFVIAEAGVNHNGSVETAMRLIDRAREAGADAVKFQTFAAERMVSRSAAKARYQRRNGGDVESQLEMLRRLELGPEAHQELSRHCRERGILFLSSPFDEESADLLERIGITRFKIASGEITNLPLLAHLARKKLPLLLSTGMSTLGEVERALATLASEGNRSVTLLHCVTEYPAPFDEVNLRAMLTLRDVFGLPVGYSDHTPGIEVSIAAVALGASVIEKHFTLSRSMEGPDHAASLEPPELARMVSAIRNVESGLGDGVKRPAPCERKNLEVARKSLVARRRLEKGERLTASNVAIKRPGFGIQPMDLDKALGRRTAAALDADEVITWELLE